MRIMMKNFAIKNFALALVIIASTTLNASALQIGVGKGHIINLPRPAAHVFVANPEIADIDVRSPSYIYVYGTKSGETTIHALDANNQPIVEVDIVVTQNTSNLGTVVNEIIPNANVYFKSLDNGVVIQGEVNTPEDAQKVVSIAAASLAQGSQIVNMLKVKGSDQVMLRVRIAEVSRTAAKNFGINLSTIFTKGALSFTLLNGRDYINDAGDFVRTDNNVIASGSPGRFDLTGVIDALEANGLVKVLAEPNLTAKSGESASFLAGGEYPIPVPQADNVISIQYREFGVRLNFTPTVLSNDRISLQVAPEVSSLVASDVVINNNAIPTLSIRRASTTVELGSGESFAIAGLIRNDTNNDISKFPWLGDIPVLGLLFRSTNFQSNESELVIIATPYIVRGVDSGDKLLTPTDGFEPANDADRVLFGMEHKETAEPGRAATGPVEGAIARYKLNGDSGYALEE